MTSDNTKQLTRSATKHRIVKPSTAVTKVADMSREQIERQRAAIHRIKTHMKDLETKRDVRDWSEQRFSPTLF